MPKYGDWNCDWQRLYAVVYMRESLTMSRDEMHSLQWQMIQFAKSKDFKVTGIFVEKPGKSPEALNALVRKIEYRGERIVLVAGPDELPDGEHSSAPAKRLRALNVEVMALPPFDD